MVTEASDATKPAQRAFEGVLSLSVLYAASRSHCASIRRTASHSQMSWVCLTRMYVSLARQLYSSAVGVAAVNLSAALLLPKEHLVFGAAVRAFEAVDCKISAN